MPSFFQRLFRSDDPSPKEQLEVLRQSLDLTPDQIDISDVFPLFAPASFFTTGKWHGPYELLQVPGLGLTWAVEQPKQTMLYVSRTTAAYWENAGRDWRQEAMRTLAKRSGPDLCTGHCPREQNPDEYYALVFMHPDGYGPSRLLFWEQLKEIFPQGYLVALPEMSCGLALAADATASERAKIEDIVHQCYSSG